MCRADRSKGRASDRLVPGSRSSRSCLFVASVSGDNNSRSAAKRGHQVRRWKERSSLCLEPGSVLLDRVNEAVNRKTASAKLNRGRIENGLTLPNSPTQPEWSTTTCTAHRRDDPNLHQQNVTRTRVRVNPRVVPGSFQGHICLGCTLPSASLQAPSNCVDVPLPYDRC
jgi:hypothetical protein